MSKNVIYAAKAQPGEYIWVKPDGSDGAKTLLVKHDGDKAIVKFYVPGYGFKTTEHRVPGTQLLKLATELKTKGGDMPKTISKKEAPAKAHKEPAKAAKPAKAPRVKKPVVPAKERLPKIAAGKKVPRIKVEGFTLRENYRYRSNLKRVRDCQAAKNEKTCKCRCLGVFHGKSHEKWLKAEQELFAKQPVGYVTARQIIALVKSLNGGKLPEHNHKKSGK